jgi:hypothetical protein
MSATLTHIERAGVFPLDVVGHQYDVVEPCLEAADASFDVGQVALCAQLREQAVRQRQRLQRLAVFPHQLRQLRLFARRLRREQEIFSARRIVIGGGQMRFGRLEVALRPRDDAEELCVSPSARCWSVADDASRSTVSQSAAARLTSPRASQGQWS